MAKMKTLFFMAVFISTVFAGWLSTFAEPVTLYKAKNVASARENMKRYPWAQTIVQDWKRNTEYALAVEPSLFQNMISDTTPWPEYGQSCPVCVGKKSTMGETGIYEWSIKDPEHLKCRYCVTVYPNPGYPEKGSMTAKKMGQTFTFYLTPEEIANPGDKSGKYAFRWASWPVHTSFSGILRYRKAAWCFSQILPMAKMYAVTGEVKYADRAALIMDLAAKVYPKWLYHSYNGTYADCPGGEAAREIGKNPRGGRFPIETIITAFPGLHTRNGYAELNNGFWGAGRFGCSGSDASFILNMTIAYDLIHEAKHADGTPVVTQEMDKRIVNDLILAGSADSDNWDEINNKCGPGRALSGAVGILFKRPESVRRSLEGFELLMGNSFHFDGFCEESPSYSDMHLSLMQNIPEILLGYTDPPGYTPKNGDVLKNFNPFTSVGRYQLALESMVRMLNFNRKYPVIGDTHFGEGISPIYAEILTDRYSERYAGLLEEVMGVPLAEKGSEFALWNRNPGIRGGAKAPLPLRSEWFPGWHVAVMRGGQPGGNTALYFNGYAHGGHRHYDTLGVMYSALGQELASDRGYIWDDPRNAWTRSTLSHNIVTVDGASQDGEKCHSTLDFFAAVPAVEVVQASANAYRQCDQYRRTTALVQISPGQTYMVDFFRVSGGMKHQYSMNCNGKLVKVDGADPSPVQEEIRWLSNIRAAVPKIPFTVTWDYNGVRLDMIMLSPVSRLLVTDAPGWRTNKGSDLNAPPVQEIIAERGFDKLSPLNSTKLVSRFATVTVPYQGGASPIKAARLLIDDPDTGALAVAVELEGRTDYIISALDQKKREYGPVTMTGSFGFVSTDSQGKVIQMYLLDGTELTSGGTLRQAQCTLAKARMTFLVASVKDRTFTLKNAIPGNLKLKGLCLLAGDTGYEIESAGGKSITVRDYPATECSEATVLFDAKK
ncbi:MAG: heparinase II/III family protein [Candidatus Latescibacter sp.]|nr:heparinase II/III family protein [Candidatus Latescibacter sp.]